MPSSEYIKNQLFGKCKWTFSIIHLPLPNYWFLIYSDEGIRLMPKYNFFTNILGSLFYDGEFYSYFYQIWINEGPTIWSMHESYQNWLKFQCSLLN